jgi:ribosome-associated protein
MVDVPASPRVDATGDLYLRPAPGLPRGLTITGDELHERFSRSSGPGGQSVNTADSRVELSWNLATSPALTDHQRERLLRNLEQRLVDGSVTIAASEQRSQLQNRVAARERLALLVTSALAPVTPRRATRPSRAARQARLDGKHRRSQTKARRGRVRDE